MAVDKKISQLASGAPAQAGDEYVVARSGANYKLTLTNIAASMPPIGATTPNTGAFTTLSASSGATISGGNLTFSSTAQRITGDFSNATHANRLSFQTNVTNGATTPFIIPNGTGTIAGIVVANASDPTNSSFGQLRINGTTAVDIISSNLGTGALLPLAFYTGGSERVRIDTSGNVGIGTASPASKLAVGGNPPTSGIVAGVSAADGISLALSDNTNNSLYVKHVSGGAATLGTDSGGQLAFATNGFSERMRIDSSGNVGIGGTAPAYTKFYLSGTYPTSINVTQVVRADGTIPSGSTSSASIFQSVPTTQAASFTLPSLSHFNATQTSFGAGSTVTSQYGFVAESTLTGATNNYGFYSGIASGSNRWNFYAAGTAQNHMAGRLGIGNTTFIDNEMLRVTQANANTGVFIDITASSSTASAGVAIRKFDNDNTTAQTYVAFAYNNGANGAGGIQGNGGTGPQFFNSSDARLKENVADLDGQLAKIMALKPRTFDFIDGPKNVTGFIAQEMEQVYPDAVGVDKDGYKTIGGVSIMEARLIKAIQELSAKVAALEAK